MTPDPRPLRSQLGGFVGPSGADPNLVNKYARQLRDAGGALILPHQMKELPKAVRDAIETEMDKAYGKKRGDHDRK